MAGIFAQWWVWVVFGLGLAVIELLLPGYIFLGFAMGAAATGVLVGIGVLAGNAHGVQLLDFALLSLAAWLGLRRMFRLPGQVKTWESDINDIAPPVPPSAGDGPRKPPFGG